MKVAAVLRLLHQDGWYLAATRGSHRQFKHPAKPWSCDGSRKAQRRIGAGHSEEYSEAVRPPEMKVTAVRYAIVIEQAAENYSAYVLDLPGCVATGKTVAEIELRIREAIEFHLEGMRQDGEAIPVPSSRVDYVEVAA
jgi:predicted RNase H-like HicB family nuclease